MMVLGFQANADYFKWELEVFAEGPGTKMETVPVIGEESLFKWGKDGSWILISSAVLSPISKL